MTLLADSRIGTLVNSEGMPEQVPDHDKSNQHPASPNCCSAENLTPHDYELAVLGLAHYMFDEQGSRVKCQEHQT